MNITVIATCLLIIVARIADVSLGTLRTAFIIQGRRSIAFLIGFFEVLIWITIVSKVIISLHQPVYAVSYAFGFGLGTFVGISVEAWMAKGRQVIRIFTRRGADIAEQLRSRGFAVTQFEGSGKEGPIAMLFLETMRKQMPQIISLIMEEDPDVFFIIDTVRHSSGRKRRYRGHTGSTIRR